MLIFCQTGSFSLSLYVFFHSRDKLILLFWAAAKGFQWLMWGTQSKSNPQVSITNVNNICSPGDAKNHQLINLHFYLHLVRADVELAEDVAQEVLDLIPGVDAIGAVQYNHNVHVCGAPCHVMGLKKKKIVCSTRPMQHNALCNLCVCKCVVTLRSWSDGLSWF